MMKRILILLVLALTQFGCGYQYGDVYEVETLGDPLRQRLEREKRDFVQSEDLNIGDKPLAAGVAGSPLRSKFIRPMATLSSRVRCTIWSASKASPKITSTTPSSWLPSNQVLDLV